MIPQTWPGAAKLTQNSCWAFSPKPGSPIRARREWLGMKVPLGCAVRHHTAEKALQGLKQYSHIWRYDPLSDL